MRDTLLAAMSEFGAVQRITQEHEAPQRGFYVYAVLNGSDVLQAGYGSNGRMRMCMRGGLAKRHNKAFICAIGEAALGKANDYAFIQLGSKERAREVERRVHARLGVDTNVHAACFIAGITDAGPVSIERVTQGLWARLVQRDVYRRLPSEQQAMADELMDLVTYATVREPNRKTCQGDILEGYILAKTNKAHLIHVFQALTNGYLRYGSHKLSDAAFAARCPGYTYAPRGRPFEVVVGSSARLPAA